MTDIYEVTMINYLTEEVKRVFFVSEGIDEVIKQYNYNYKVDGFDIVSINSVNQESPVHIV